MSKILLRFLIAGFLLFTNETLRADNPPEKTPDKPPEKTITKEQIAALIEQLGDASYGQREAAEKKLIEIGSPVVDQVKKMTQHTDLEIRKRAVRILTVLRYLNAEKIGWTAFSRLVGESSEAREFYHKMFRCESEFWKQYATSPEIAALQVQSRLAEFKNDPQQKISAPSTATFLFLIATSKQSPLVEHLSDKLWGVVQSAEFVETLEKKTYLWKLIQAWINRSAHSAGYRKQVLHLALQLNSKEAVGLWVDALGAADASAIDQLVAVREIGNLGNRQHIKVLEPLLDDSKTCLKGRARRPDVQLRDVALAMLVHLSGQPIKEYGFKHAAPDRRSRYPYKMESLYFENDNQRQQAIAKWRKWSQANPVEVQKAAK